MLPPSGVSVAASMLFGFYSRVFFGVAMFDGLISGSSLMLLLTDISWEISVSFMAVASYATRREAVEHF